MAFPVAKLAALIIKQVSKPLANIIKTRAKSSPFFRTYICMPPAQFYHWAEVKLKMWTLNLGKPVTIPKLNENMAIDLGAELVGEGIIFSIAAVIVVIEYTRSSRKEAAKEEVRTQELIRIQEELKELYFAKARQEAQIRELVRILHINLPSASYAPQPYRAEDIPLHHRTGPLEDNNTSIWQSMNNFIWAAVDVIIPPTKEHHPEVVGPHLAEECPTPVSCAIDADQATAVAVSSASPSPVPPLPVSPVSPQKTESAPPPPASTSPKRF